MEKSFTCKCSRDFETMRSLVAHRRWCLVYRNGKPPISAQPFGVWNKGLTSKTDARLAKAGKKISAALIGKPGHRPSKEGLLKLSVLQSERLLKSYADGTRVQSGGKCKWFEVDGVKVQGTWELRTARILSTWKAQGQILDWSRCNLRFSYKIGDQDHTYTPDFLITKTDGSRYILEVKGRKSLIDDLKWASVKDLDLVVWKLKDIKNNEFKL